MCDYPGCGASIDRGLAYACGGGVTGEDNCGLFFCNRHLFNVFGDGELRHPVCERCLEGRPSFDPTLDAVEWAKHVLTDESWARWRAEEPEWVADMERLVATQ